MGQGRAKNVEEYGDINEGQYGSQRVERNCQQKIITRKSERSRSKS